MNDKFLALLCHALINESEEAGGKARTNPNHPMCPTWITAGYIMASLAAAVANAAREYNRD